MLSLISAIKELTSDEAEYIKQKLTIFFAEIKLEELEAKEKNERRRFFNRDEKLF